VTHVGELQKLQAAAMGLTKFVNLGKGSAAMEQAKSVNLGEGSAKSCEEKASLDSSHGKYEIHLNVSGLSGCYLNFGSGANAPAFPVVKND
jgi:hypothetical protein